MLFAFSVVAATVGSFAVIARALRNAPEAFEDEHGFHIIKHLGKPTAGFSVRSTRNGVSHGELPQGAPSGV